MDTDKNMNQTTRNVKLTQILIDYGWLFVDNGHNYIEGVINDKASERITFSSESEFENWFEQQAETYLNN